jgi:uncharacterized membrane protein
MSKKVYLLVSAAIFALVALLHLVRLATHGSVLIGAVTFPFWGSWLVLLISVALSIWAFSLMGGWRKSH